WEQRKFIDIVERLNRTEDNVKLPRIEFEDIVSGEGRLNKDINIKNDVRKGIFFDENNILYGKLRPYLRKWYYARFAGIAIGDFWVLKIINNNYPLFIYYLIQTESYQKVANDTSGTKMPRSNWKKVSESLFYIPNINEQQKTSTIFITIDNLITLHQRN
ncbi:restriction endonuclease subunit S, partial [Enterococcus cecorum]|uniref:restriction endonuclease subunit S n=1 Tax=Enterococcus cecorum TaxID=44008 RepID=UPI001FAD8007